MKLNIDVRSLSVQLIALVLIVAIVPVIVLTFYSTSTIAAQKNAEFDQTARQIGQIGQLSFESQLTDNQLIAADISADASIMDGIRNHDASGLKKTVDQWASKYQNCDAITIADKDGVILARSASAMAGDKTTNEYILDALAGKDTSGIDLMSASTIQNNNLADKVRQSGNGQGLAIITSIPIMDSQENIVGALFVADLQNENTALVDTVGTDASGYASLFQGDVRVATNMRDSAGNRITGSKADAAIASRVLNGETVYQKYTASGMQLYGCYLPLKTDEGKTVGMMAVSYDIGPALADMNNMTMMLIGIGAIIAILAALVGFFVVNRTIRPINRLVSVSNEVAGGNLETRIETGANGGEIGVLTHSIAQMVSNIKDRITYNESILKGITDPLYVVNTESTITYVNEPGARLLGSSVHDLTGKKLGDQFTVAGSASGESYLARSLRTGESFSGFEQQIQTRSGSKVYVRGSNAPIRDAGGRVTGAVELLQDITQSKEAADAIARAEKDAMEKALFSDSILKSITDCHFVFDTKGNLTYINDVAQKMTGWSEREATGRPIEDIIGTQNSNTRKALVEQKNIYNSEGRIVARGGKEIPVIVNVTLLKDLNGSVTGVNAMLKDITKEKEAKRQLTEIMTSANQIAEQVSGASGNVASSIQQVMSASRQISESIQQIASGSQSQAKSIENVNKLMHEMSSSISTVTEGAKKTSEDAVRANAEARKGSENAKVAIRKMEELHGAVNDSAKIVADLGEKSKQIGQIVDMITAIAGQTNLLALNAAIEAARAGDAGRGFAVVAEEVRKLAEESAKAAEQINALIGEVRDQTSRAVESMNKGTKEVDESNKIVAESLKSLEDISRLIDTTAAKAQEIAAMTEKQSADTQRVVKDVEEMAAVIEESAAGSEEVSASSEETTATAEQVSGMASELAKISDALKAEVGKLKVE